MEIIEVNNLPTLCLNMIVKNESKIIKRLLSSVLPIIDSYCICDTGSTDNTIELIETFFKEKNIPGKIVHEPFKNFCHNRTFAFKSAYGMSDYLLLMDADMILEIISFDKHILNKYDCFHVLQGNNNFYYQNIRIVKNNGLFSYLGVTHEYINFPSDMKILSLPKDSLFIIDIGDGGSKSNKFKRDIKLLNDGIKDEPNNVRYYFYLANSYYDHGDTDLAIYYYKKRIIMNGWEQEVWYSYYRIGLCYKRKNKMDKAICMWLEGFNSFPGRIENLYEIVNYYRIMGKQKIAYQFYLMAYNILQKKNKDIDNYLFLHKDIYSYKLIYEYTIIAAYVGIKNISEELLIILNNCNDNSIIDNLLNNLKFYTVLITPIHTLCFDDKMHVVVNNEDILFTSSSSCLISNMKNDGYYLNIRYVNHNINLDGSYVNIEKNISTANKFIELDKNFTKIREHIFDLPYTNKRYLGIEDIKIYEHQNKIVYLGTGLQNDNVIGMKYGIYNTEKKELEEHDLKTSFNKNSCERNWVFVNYKDSCHVIYKWFPLMICKINNNYILDLIEEKKMPQIFSRIRGSSCGFTYEDEIWFIVHLVSSESPRHYYHMIVKLNFDMTLKCFSAPFKFHGDCIEYSLSIVVETERVLINYSMMDRTTRIGIYDKKYIDNIVKFT